MDRSLESSRRGQSDAPQRFTDQLKNWRSGGTAPPSDGSTETEAAWRTWFDTTFGHLIIFHCAVFYNRSNVPMDADPNINVDDLCHELGIACSRIEELVNNFF